MADGLYAGTRLLPPSGVEDARPAAHRVGDALASGGLDSDWPPIVARSAAPILEEPPER